MRERGHPENASFWSAKRRRLLAELVPKISHWEVMNNVYWNAPDIPATWFVDPPYNNNAGKAYKHGQQGIYYGHLGSWCRSRKGQVIVCENAGADWLPFMPFRKIAGTRNKNSSEVIWTKSTK